jgi:SAM-dependent methyltransferase
MECGGDIRATAHFLVRAARELAGVEQTDGLAVLDFGCGRGDLVRALSDMGFNARGCDFSANLDADEHLSPIHADPYRLPYPTDSFDLVISTSVFEHAQRTEECMAEIHRVLRPGGVAMHSFPGKWYLPVEPHIYVPLVNWFWPVAQRPWLALWAIAGIRNEYQKGLSWREVTRLNATYVREGLCYRTTKHYSGVSDRVFGNHNWAMRFYIEHSPGRAAALARRMPLKSLTGRLIRECREGFLVQRKTGSKPVVEQLADIRESEFDPPHEALANPLVLGH